MLNENNWNGEGGKMQTQYLSRIPFPSWVTRGSLLFLNVFLLLWRVLGDGWVDGSGRCSASAPNIAQSFAYFPCLLSQTTAIIQWPTNSPFLCFLWHFYCRRLVGALHCSSNCFPGKLGKSNSWWVVTSWTPVLLSHAHKQPRQRHTPAFSNIPFLLLLHANTHSIVKSSHQMPVKLNGAHLCLIKLQLHTCILLPFNNSIYWF